MNESTEQAQPDAADEISERIGMDQALALAIQFHRSGRLPEAERLYRTLLEAVPEHVDALHFLGLLTHQAGESEEAERLIRRAIELRPDYVDAHSNLGNLLRARGCMAEAAEAYRRAVALAPHVQAYNNLGVALKDLGRRDEAESVLRQAIALEPNRGDAHFNLANVLTELDRDEEARDEYRRAIELEPMLVMAYDSLARTLRNLGRDDEAIEVLEQLLARAPGNPVAQHMLAAFQGWDVPAQASDGYVQVIFDTFAESFDHVLKALEYRAPELVAEAISKSLGAGERELDVLDAGCGTGLCGPLLKPFARRLVGVDLSAGMLRRAQDRNLYDELVQAELTSFMRHHAERFDLIASADTLVYFGDLAPVLAAAADALRRGGVLAFTLEDGGDQAAEPGFELHTHGRYSHAAGYVRRTLERAGFDRVEIGREVLRKERDSPVAGLVVTARKP